MPSEVAVPALGLGRSNGVLAEWYLPDGAQVQPGDLVCRYETDHIAFEVEAEDAGTLRHRVAAGGRPAQGATAALILAPGEDEPAAPLATWGLDPHPVAAPEAAVEEAAAPDTEAAVVVRDEALPAAVPADGPGSGWDAFAGTGNGGFHWPSLDEDRREDDRRRSLRLFSRLTESEGADDTAAGDPGSGDADAPDGGPGIETWPAFAAPEDERESHGEADPGGWPADAAATLDDTSGWPADSRWGEAPAETPAPPSWGARAPFATAPPADDGAVDEDAIAAGTAPARDGTPPAVALPVPAAASVRVRVDLGGFRRLAPEFRTEWAARGIDVSETDVVVRAAGHALVAAGVSDNPVVHLVQPHARGEWRADIVSSTGALEATVREREAGPSGATPACTLYDFAAAGIEEAVAPLAPGQPLAFAIGAPGDRVLSREGGIFVVPAAAVTLTYDPAVVDPGTAAAIAAHLRDLAEAPYTLLAS